MARRKCDAGRDMSIDPFKTMLTYDMDIRKILEDFLMKDIAAEENAKIDQALIDLESRTGDRE